VFELRRKVAHSLAGTPVGPDQLLDGDNTPLLLSAIQHRCENFLQGAGDMNDGDCLAGSERLLYQPLGMLGITQGRIEDNLRAPGDAGYRQRGAFSRRISACGEHHTIPAFGRCFRKRPQEQFITNPGGRGVHGNPVLRLVLVVFVEQRGCVIRVQYVPNLLVYSARYGSGFVRSFREVSSRTRSSSGSSPSGVTGLPARLSLSWRPPPL
jgi:hypothetical protein